MFLKGLEFIKFDKNWHNIILIELYDLPWNYTRLILIFTAQMMKFTIRGSKLLHGIGINLKKPH